MKKVLSAVLALGLLASLHTPVLAQGLMGKGYTANATHATATVTLAAKAGYQWEATAILASCATTPGSPVSLVIKDGSTTVISTNITTPVALPLVNLGNSPGNAMSAALGDCGVGVVGSVNLVAIQR